MKLFKSFLLASVMVATLTPYSASAHITADDLADKIRITRAAPAPVVKEEAPKGWFSSFRQSVGNGFRYLGDRLRQEENTETAAGHVKQAAKDYVAAGISAKLHIPVSTSIFNSIGNGLRTVGQWVKGGEETQTPTRVVLNNLGLNKSANKDEIAYSLKTAASAIIKADAQTAPEAFLDVVKGLNLRGHSTKELDVYGIFVKELAHEEFSKQSSISFADFAKNMSAKGFDALENTAVVKAATTPTAKLNLINKVLRETYDQGVARVKADMLRQQVLVAPSA